MENALSFPLALLAALAIPLLIFAYLKKKKGKTIRVSSLLFLKDLPQHSFPSRKPKLPLRFFLELLALLLLVAASSKPLFFSQKKNYILVIDNSPSTAAKYKKSSRLETAMEKAIDWLTELPSNAGVSLWKTSPENELLARGSPFSQILEDQINDLMPANSPGPDSTLLENLLNLSEEITFISDKKVDKKNKRINHISVFSPEENIYVKDAALYENANGKKMAKIEIKAETKNKAQVQVILLGGRIFSDKFTKISKAQIEIPAGESKIVKLNAKSTARLFKVEIHPEGKDAISQDNEAWLSTFESSSRSIIVVRNEEVKTGLSNLKDSKVKEVSPEEFKKIDALSLKKYDLGIFYRHLPHPLPSIDSLFILPPESNRDFYVSELQEDLKISSWNKTHPVLRYLTVPLLSPKEAVLMQPHSAADSLLSTASGSIALVGEDGKKRWIALGFEILPWEGLKTPSSSILLLNSLAWLKGVEEQRVKKGVGGKLTCPEDHSCKLSIPLKGKSNSLRGSESSLIQTRGFYVFEISLKGNSEKELITANAFFPEESNTLFEGQVEVNSKSKIKAKKSGMDLWKWLALVALCVILIDTCLRFIPGEKR